MSCTKYSISAASVCSDETSNEKRVSATSGNPSIPKRRLSVVLRAVARPIRPFIADTGPSTEPEASRNTVCQRRSP